LPLINFGLLQADLPLLPFFFPSPRKDLVMLCFRCCSVSFSFYLLLMAALLCLYHTLSVISWPFAASSRQPGSTPVVPCLCEACYFIPAAICVSIRAVGAWRCSYNPGAGSLTGIRHPFSRSTSPTTLCLFLPPSPGPGT
jgi:hypothetical protein